MRSPLVALAVTAALLSPGAAARADSGELRLDVRLELALALSAAAAAHAIDGLAPATRCVLCGPTRLDEEAREAFRRATPGGIREAWRASDRLVGIVLPAGAAAASAIPALLDGEPRALVEDAVVITEAAWIAGDLNALAKRTFGRARPAAGAGDPRGDSFYSAHTSRACALAVASATVATLRGRRGARWVWLGGLALASTVGYLRLASDKHWLTDVAAGAAVGSSVGVVVPLLHRRRRGRRSRVGLAPGGLALVF